jgi:hypothetical protein
MDEIDRMKQDEIAGIQQSDNEERKRIHESIHQAEIKKASILFMVTGTIIEIIITLVVLFGLYILAAYLIFKVFGIKSPVAFQIMYPLIFIGGIVLGFFLYKQVMRWSIKKFHLEKKLKSEIIEHYLSRRESLERKMKE